MEKVQIHRETTRRKQARCHIDTAVTQLCGNCKSKISDINQCEVGSDGHGFTCMDCWMNLWSPDGSNTICGNLARERVEEWTTPELLQRFSLFWDQSPEINPSNVLEMCRKYGIFTLGEIQRIIKSQQYRDLPRRKQLNRNIAPFQLSTGFNRPNRKAIPPQRPVVHRHPANRKRPPPPPPRSRNAPMVTDRKRIRNFSGLLHELVVNVQKLH